MRAQHAPRSDRARRRSRAQGDRPVSPRRAETRRKAAPARASAAPSSLASAANRVRATESPFAKASNGLLQHGVIPGPCHTKARGISSPGIDEGPPHGALQSWRAAMEHYVGLDVSLKLTAICIVDQTGRIEREGVVASNPEAIAAFIKSHAPHVTRIGLETGATSTWLWTELNKLGLPVICIDARHAKAALKMQINKSDRNDAVGIARIMQCGWYKEVRVKDLDSH